MSQKSTSFRYTGRRETAITTDFVVWGAGESWRMHQLSISTVMVMQAYFLPLTVQLVGTKMTAAAIPILTLRR